MHSYCPLLFVAGWMGWLFQLRGKKNERPAKEQEPDSQKEFSEEVKEILTDAMNEEVLSYSWGNLRDGKQMPEGSFFVFVKTRRGTFVKNVIISGKSGEYTVSARGKTIYLSIKDPSEREQEKKDGASSDLVLEETSKMDKDPKDDFSPLVWLHQPEIREKLRKIMPQEAHRKFTIPASLLPKDRNLWQSFAKEKYACGFDAVSIEKDGIRVKIAG